MGQTSIRHISPSSTMTQLPWKANNDCKTYIENTILVLKRNQTEVSNFVQLMGHHAGWYCTMQMFSLVVFLEIGAKNIKTLKMHDWEMCARTKTEICIRTCSSSPLDLYSSKVVAKWYYVAEKQNLNQIIYWRIDKSFVIFFYSYEESLRHNEQSTK